MPRALCQALTRSLWVTPPRHPCSRVGRGQSTLVNHASALPAAQCPTGASLAPQVPAPPHRAQTRRRQPVGGLHGGQSAKQRLNARFGFAAETACASRPSYRATPRINAPTEACGAGGCQLRDYGMPVDGSMRRTHQIVRATHQRNPQGCCLGRIRLVRLQRRSCDWHAAPTSLGAGPR